MSTSLLFQFFTISADLVIFVFVGYYLLKIRSKEQTLEKKEDKIDTNYHQIVDNALTKERKILEDASFEADKILSGAEYVNDTTKEAINQALQNVVVEIQKEAVDTARTFMNSYQESLKKLVIESLTQFQKVTKELEGDLQKQTEDFHNTLLPSLQKELEEYKKIRLKDTDQMVIRIVEKASQEILNKALSFSDHQAIVAESLEKAKKEGMFD